MPQKLCATCNKELTATERALNEIQCTKCYQQWLNESVAQAEPAIRRLLEEIEQEKKNSARHPA
jgi:Zn-finger nucleic acid-binding protein